MSGTQYGPVGTRFLWFKELDFSLFQETRDNFLILGIRFWILGTRIGSLNAFKKPWSYTVMYYKIGVCTSPTNIERTKTLQLHFLLFVCLVRIHSPHIFSFTTQKQCWWGAITETTHQQLLRLFSIMQEGSVIDESNILWVVYSKTRRLPPVQSALVYRR